MPPKYKPSPTLSDFMKKPKGKTQSPKPCVPTTIPAAPTTSTKLPASVTEPYFDVYHVSMPGCVGWHWCLWTGKHSKIFAGHSGDNAKTKEQALKNLEEFKRLVAAAKIQTREEV